ncbi:MAG: PAS domain S-box protein [Firmicutes bacterium]|nr:PAS domain S-box protein [Bacillota bacterium]
MRDSYTQEINKAAAIALFGDIVLLEKFTLTFGGYFEIFFAGCIEEAEKILNKKKISFAILGDGFEDPEMFSVLDRINERLPSVPVFFYCGSSDGSCVDEAFARGAFDVIFPDVFEPSRQKRFRHIIKKSLECLSTKSEISKKLSLHENAMDAIDFPFCYKDTKGRYLWSNKAYSEYIGFPYDSLIGKTIFDIAPPTQAAQQTEIESAIIDKSSAVLIEARIRKNDGDYNDVIFNKAAFHGPDNKVAGVAEIIFDITEQKKLEEELRISRERFLGFADSTFEGIIITEEGKLIDANEQLAEMFGYDLEEMIGNDILEFVHPDDRNMVAERRNSNFDKPYTQRGLKKDGSVIYLETRGRNVSVGSKKLRITSIRDITVYKNLENELLQYKDYLEEKVEKRTQELKIANESLKKEIKEKEQAENALRESERTLRALFDAIPESAYLLNTEGIILQANSTLARRYEKTLEEITGVDSYSLIGEHTAQARRKIIEKAVITREPVEFIDSRLGKIVHNYLYPVTDNDGNVVELALIGIDITERMKNEEEREKLIKSLEEQKLLLDMIIASTPDNFYVLDRNLHLLFSSPEVKQRNDRILQGSMRKNWDELVMPFEILGHITNNINTILEEGIDYQGETSYESENETRHFDYSIAPGMHTDGSINWAVVTVRDITRKKRDETMLKVYADKLARSNAELEEFAYIASHDLQEPLRKIVNFANLIEVKYKGKLDENADRYIFYVVDGAKRMQRLISDLLEYSRIGYRQMPREKVNLGNIVEEAVHDLMTSIQEAGASISIQTLPDVMGNRSALQRMFQNLISNALKFRGEKKPIIIVSSEKEGSKWHISVKDNGIGIEPQYYQRIFKAFQRLHTMDQYPGTGIGLAVCKKVAERHDGSIDVESIPNKGSIFRVTFPVIGHE